MDELPALADRAAEVGLGAAEAWLTAAGMPVVRHSPHLDGDVEAVSAGGSNVSVRHTLDPDDHILRIEFDLRLVEELKSGQRQWAVLQQGETRWLCRWNALPEGAARTPGEGFLLGLRQSAPAAIPLSSRTGASAGLCSTSAPR